MLFYVAEYKVALTLIFFFQGINRVSEEVLAQKRIFTDYKEEKSLKLKTFKTLQYNITRILHKSSSNRMFCSIHDFTFLMTDTKIKEHVPFES